MAKLLRIYLLPIPVSVLPVTAQAASVEEFYRGKTIQFIVGGSAGGGYDTYTRLIGRHIGQYIPGKPSTVVQNMPGAGMLIVSRGQGKIVVHGVEGSCGPAVRVSEDRLKVFDCTDGGNRQLPWPEVHQIMRISKRR